MNVHRIRRFLLIALLPTTACGIVEPCDFNVDNNMDGHWQLTRYNGSPIPAQGIVIGGTSNRLVAGTVFFKTYTYTRCDDAVGRVTSGALVATYNYMNAVGTTAGSSYHGAKFIYDNGTGALTISAGNLAFNGDRFGNEFTMEQDFGGITYALTFTQTFR